MPNEAIFCLHVNCFSMFVYEIKAEVACGLNVQFEPEYGWLLGGNSQNYVW